MSSSQEAQRRNAQGICRLCSRPNVPDRTMCQVHLDGLKEHYKERQREGLCIACLEPALPGHRFCGKHRDQNRTTAKQARERHKQLGLCTVCLKPVEPGKSMCAKHLERLRKQANERRIRDRIAWLESKGLKLIEQVKEPFEKGVPVEAIAEATGLPVFRIRWLLRLGSAKEPPKTKRYLPNLYDRIFEFLSKNPHSATHEVTVGIEHGNLKSVKEILSRSRRAGYVGLVRRAGTATWFLRKEGWSRLKRVPQPETAVKLPLEPIKPEDAFHDLAKSVFLRSQGSGEFTVDPSPPSPVPAACPSRAAAKNPRTVRCTVTGAPIPSCAPSVGGKLEPSPAQTRAPGQTKRSLLMTDMRLVRAELQAAIDRFVDSMVDLAQEVGICEDPRSPKQLPYQEDDSEEE